MKALNTMKYTANMVEELCNYKKQIKAAETYEEAESVARMMIGYMNCMITFLNTMICKENNDFTAEFDELIDSYTSEMYGLLKAKAINTKQNWEKIVALGEKEEMFAA